jgi:hypothetical protein
MTCSLPSLRAFDVSRATLDMKHRLMYVDIRMLCLLKDCLGQAGERACQSDGVLNRAVKDYKIYDEGCQASSIFEVIDKIFESHLVELYECRVELTRSLFSQLPSKKLSILLEDIDLHLGGIIRTLNMDGDVATETLAAWEKKVDLFHEQFCILAAKKNLKVVCGQLYSKVLRKAEIRILYLSWEKELEQQSRPILEQSTCPDGFWYVFKIQQLLRTTKNTFFEQFFLGPGCKSLAFGSCIQILREKDSNALDLLRELVEQIRLTKGRIAVFERKLVASMSHASFLIGTLAHILIDNPYTRNASFLVESQERATQGRVWKSVSVLSTPLQHSYLVFSKIAATAGLFGLDVLEWKWLGVSYSMLYAVSHQFTPSVATCINGFQLMGADETTALYYLPTIRTVFECAIFAGVSSYSAGFTAGSLCGAALSYGIGKIASLYAGKCIDLGYQIGRQDKQTSPMSPLLKGLAQRIAFPLAQRYIVPYFLAQVEFLIPPKDLLANEAVCLANKMACKREACKVLGLSPTATAQEVKKVYRQLALQYHPDRNPSGSEMFRKLTFAKKVCGET